MSTKSKFREYTIAQAAKLLGISPQRVHVLIKQHRVKVRRVTSRLFVVSTDELAKIPRDRPSGKHLTKK